MKKHFSTLFLFEFLALCFVLILTREQLVFHVFKTITLTPQLVERGNKFSTFRNYHIECPMMFRINIGSDDGSKIATLLWPSEPYQMLFVLIPNQEASLNTQNVFEGKMVRCYNKCEPSNMPVVMKDFKDTLLMHYPEFKDRTAELPFMILDTSQAPGGPKLYMQKTRNYWLGYMICLVAGGLWLIRKSLLDRSRIKARKKKENTATV